MMESENISDSRRSICIHCCGPIRQSNGNDDNKFQHSSSLANSTYNVPKALSSIFKLNYLKPFDTLEWRQKDEEDEELTSLCICCKDVLADLYDLYQNFVQLGQIDSVLSKKLHRLDEIIDRHEQKSINCDLIITNRPEASQDGEETRDNNKRISNPSASTSSASSQLCLKELNVLLTRLPENVFTSTTKTTTKEVEEEFNESPSDQEENDDSPSEQEENDDDDDYNPDWLEVKMEEDEDSDEAPGIQIVALQDIIESDVEDEKPLMTSYRRNRRKQDLSSSKINQSSSSAIRCSPLNISMTQARVIRPKNNNECIDGNKTLKHLECGGFQISVADENPLAADEKDPLAADEKDPLAAHDEEPGDNGNELTNPKLIQINYLPTSASSSAGDKHKCPLCQIYTPSTSYLVNHLFLMHAPKGATCPLCRKVLSRREHLKDHLCNHVGHRPLSCPGSNCTLSFLKRPDLRRHFAVKHKGETLNEESLKSVEIIDLTHISWDPSSSLILNALSQMNAAMTTIPANNVINTTTTIGDPVTPASVPTEEADDNKINFQTLNCPKCSKKFLYPKNLQAHRKICHVKKTTTKKQKKQKRVTNDEDNEDPPEFLKCPLCTKEFLGKFELSDHLWASHVVQTKEGKKTDCSLCDKKYPTDPSKLKTHILFTHAAAAEGEHECPTCGKKFYRACNLSRHIPTHEKIPKSYECKVCLKTFANPQSLNIHMKRHTKDYQYSCLVSGCDRAFLCSSDLKRHEYKAHPKEGQSMPHICKVCGKGFVFRHVMKAHELIHMDRPFSCPKCNRRFVSESENLNHQQKGCKEKARFQCHICDKSYATHHSLQSHLRFHAGDAVVCPVAGCGKKFYDKSALATHVKGHDKTFKCPDPNCGKCFSNSSNLIGHLQAKHPHLVPEKVAAAQLCPVCGESVLGKARLKRHMHKHTNERPHKCHLCESAYKTSGSLHLHLRIHAKDKSHPCTFEGCSKSFYTAQNLEKHRRVHTGEKNYLCPECGKSFGLPENLRKHSLIHSAERRFQCQICDKAFKQPQSLKTHQATHAK